VVQVASLVRAARAVRATQVGFKHLELPGETRGWY